MFIRCRNQYCLNIVTTRHQYCPKSALPQYCSKYCPNKYCPKTFQNKYCPKYCPKHCPNQYCLPPFSKTPSCASRLRSNVQRYSWTNSIIDSKQDIHKMLPPIKIFTRCFPQARYLQDISLNQGIYKKDLWVSAGGHNLKVLNVNISECCWYYKDISTAINVLENIYEGRIVKLIWKIFFSS